MMRKISHTAAGLLIVMVVCAGVLRAGGEKPAKPGETAAGEKAQPKGKVINVATDGSGDFNCNGVDDHVEINQAIEAVNKAGGGTVHLKKGTYIINDSVILCSNLVFEGEGQEATVIKVRDKNNRIGWKHIHGNRVSNTVLQHFALDGNKQGQTMDRNRAREGQTDGIYFENSDHVTVQHITCKNVFTDNFDFALSSDCIVRRCQARVSSHDGYRAGGCKRITFADNLAWCLGDLGVRIYSSSDCIVERNRLYAGDSGIFVSKQGSGKMGNNIFRDNYINNTKWGNYSAIAIEASEGATIDNDLFIRNIIDTCNGHGFYIGTGYTGGTISNLKIINCTINKCKGSGICVNRTQRGRGNPGPTKVINCLVKNCIIVNCGVREGGELRETHGRGIYGNAISKYNNIWNNAGGGYGGGAKKGPGDISKNPYFVGQTNFRSAAYKRGAFGWPEWRAFTLTPTVDLHLQSKAQRWDAGTGSWVWDAVSGPCIDAGDPSDDCSNEPKPNGGRINMGAYGNTKEASKSGAKHINQ